MTRKTKALTSFGTRLYTAEQLYVITTLIIEGMTANATFPTTGWPTGIPTIANLTTLNGTYFAALQAAVNKGTVNTATRNDQREKLESMLSQIANYVNSVANGDLAILLTTGFVLSKDSSPVGPLPQPSNFRVRALNPEQLYLIVDAVYGARIYQWEVQELDATGHPVGDPITMQTTDSRTTVTGLVSTKQYTCRVVALGSDDSARNYSIPITQTVL